MFYSQLILESDLSQMGKVDAFLESIVQHFGIKDDFAGILNLPLVECVKNAIIHGNKMNKHKTVVVDFQIKESKLSFTVTDEGQGFDYETILTHCDNAPEKNGLFIVNRLAEDIAFSKNGSQVSYKVNVPFSVSSPVNRAAILQQKAEAEEKCLVGSKKAESLTSIA